MKHDMCNLKYVALFLSQSYKVLSKNGGNIVKE